jgi:hypothetical protein
MESQQKEEFEDTKEVIRILWRSDNKMVKGQKKRQTTIYKKLHMKLKIE